jgi:hypothetical protein
MRRNVHGAVCKERFFVMRGQRRELGDPGHSRQARKVGGLETKTRWLAGTWARTYEDKNMGIYAGEARFIYPFIAPTLSS